MQSLAVMRNDIRTQYEIGLSTSHYGRPSVVGVLRTGRRGRPRLVFDPDFLRWAVTQRTTSRIASFLSVGRTTLRQAMLDYGLVEPGDNPFLPEGSVSPDPSDTVLMSSDDDDILEPEFLLPLSLPQEVVNATSVAQYSTLASSTAILSTMTDEQLDNLLLQLKTHFRRAGITMLDGMLRQLGHRVPRDRIKASLLRIDPVHRVFNRIHIRRRVYSVPGPNSLWHHDGQHGLIRWGIIIHGFIDGYSRLITGLRASNNNFALTVLQLFLDASGVYGIPLRLRGDHGTENLLVAAWMEEFRGTQRGSYIWGRLVIIF